MSEHLQPMTCGNCGGRFARGDERCPACGVSRAEAESAGRERDDEVTEASKDSFPTSDPPAY